MGFSKDIGGRNEKNGIGLMLVIRNLMQLMQVAQTIKCGIYENNIMDRTCQIYIVNESTKFTFFNILIDIASRKEEKNR